MKSIFKKASIACLALTSVCWGSKKSALDEDSIAINRERLEVRRAMPVADFPETFSPAEQQVITSKVLQAAIDGEQRRIRAEEKRALHITYLAEAVDRFKAEEEKLVIIS